MSANNKLPWIVGGDAAAAALYYWHRERKASHARSDRDEVVQIRGTVQ
jgi:hypothetical protein